MSNQSEELLNPYIPYYPASSTPVLPYGIYLESDFRNGWSTSSGIACGHGFLNYCQSLGIELSVAEHKICASMFQFLGSTDGFEILKSALKRAGLKLCVSNAGVDMYYIRAWRTILPIAKSFITQSRDYICLASFYEYMTSRLQIKECSTINMDVVCDHWCTAEDFSVAFDLANQSVILNNYDGSDIISSLSNKRISASERAVLPLFWQYMSGPQTERMLRELLRKKRLEVWSNHHQLQHAQHIELRKNHWALLTLLRQIKNISYNDKCSKSSFVSILTDLESMTDDDLLSLYRIKKKQRNNLSSMQFLTNTAEFSIYGAKRLGRDG